MTTPYRTKDKPMAHSKIESILNTHGVGFRYVSDHIVAEGIGDVNYFEESALLNAINKKAALTYPLSPADIELIHRVLNVNALANFNAQTVNTGGNCMNDLYTLTDGRVLCVYEYGVCVYPSMQSWEDSEYEHEGYVHMDWEDRTHLHVNECTTLEQLTNLWSDNCELIFDEVGSADELLAEHGKRIAINEREWVDLFIARWELVARGEV